MGQGQVTVLPRTFDYDDGEQRIVVEQRYTEALSLMRQGLISLIEAGGKLAEIRDLLRHNKAGGFDSWIETKGLTRRTVYRFIELHTAFPTVPHVAQLDIPATAAYLLASASVPEEARQEALDRGPGRADRRQGSPPDRPGAPARLCAGLGA